MDDRGVYDGCDDFCEGARVARGTGTLIMDHGQMSVNSQGTCTLRTNP